MAVKIRLARRGRKKLAMYDVVVADARAPRDGRFIEKLGTYNPNTDPASIDINAERAFKWVMDGAQPTDTVRAMLSYKGVLYRKHLQIGVNKGAITQEQADAKLADWLKEKEAKITNKIEGIASQKAADAKARFEAETKVKEARAEAILKKQAVVAPVAEDADEVEEATEEVAVEATTAEEAAPEATATEEVAEAPAKDAEPAPEAEAAAPEEAPAEKTEEVKAEENTEEATAATEAAPEAKAEEAAPEAKAEEDAPKAEEATEDAPEEEAKEEKEEK